jgi:hypothetical protein
MELPLDVIITVSATAGGVVLGALGKFILDLRKFKRDSDQQEVDQALAVYHEVIEQLKEQQLRNAAGIRELMESEKECVQQKVKIEMLTGRVDDLTKAEAECKRLYAEASKEIQLLKQKVA